MVVGPQYNTRCHCHLFAPLRSFCWISRYFTYPAALLRDICPHNRSAQQEPCYNVAATDCADSTVRQQAAGRCPLSREVGSWGTVQRLPRAMAVDNEYPETLNSTPLPPPVPSFRCLFALLPAWRFLRLAYDEAGPRARPSVRLVARCPRKPPASQSMQIPER